MNRIADRILNAVLRQQKAAAACGPYYYQTWCSGGLRYRAKCRFCPGGTSCHPAVVIGAC